MAKKILIVDDEAAVLRFLIHVFQREGYEVLSATNLTAAIASCEAITPDFVLTDIKLGNASGVDLLKWLRENRPKVPCLMMTGFSASMSLDLQCEVIYKPFSPREVLMRVMAKVMP